MRTHTERGAIATVYSYRKEKKIATYVYCVFQAGDLSAIETAYTEALDKMNETEKSAAELEQSLGDFYMDIGLFDAAK